MPNPTIVCLCGSTRFQDAFIQAQLVESLAGKIVLTLASTHHGTDDELFALLGYDDAQAYTARRNLEELHLAKIDLAHEILVLNVNGYVGSTTTNEIIYAIKHGKRVRWLE